jgi:hypothetical protein
MGSGRRIDADGAPAVPGMPGFFGNERPADGAGMEGCLLLALPGGSWPGRERLRPRKSSAVLRTWEKSYYSSEHDGITLNHNSNCWCKIGHSEDKIGERRGKEDGTKETNSQDAPSV